MMLILFSSRIYNKGISSDLGKLYPEVKFPVSRGTKRIASSIKWDHSQSWFVGDYSKSSKSDGDLIKISLNDERFQYLNNFLLDGRIFIPSFAYLEMVWSLFNSKCGAVEFSNVEFNKQVELTKVEEVFLEVNVQKISGRFEVSV